MCLWPAVPEIVVDGGQMQIFVLCNILQVSYSAILFYGYVGVVGLAVWSALRYFKSSVALSQIWCTYGTPRSNPSNRKATLRAQ